MLRLGARPCIMAIVGTRSPVPYPVELRALSFNNLARFSSAKPDERRNSQELNEVKSPKTYAFYKKML